MKTDISIVDVADKDARLLEETARYIREFARATDSENYNDELRILRSYIKRAMEVLLHNLPVH